MRPHIKRQTGRASTRSTSRCVTEFERGPAYHGTAFAPQPPTFSPVDNSDCAEVVVCAVTGAVRTSEEQWLEHTKKVPAAAILCHRTPPRATGAVEQDSQVATRHSPGARQPRLQCRCSPTHFIEILDARAHAGLPEALAPLSPRRRRQSAAAAFRPRPACGQASA